VKVRLSGRLFGITRFSRTDLDFDSTEHGYLMGPVRVVRVMQSRLRLVGRLSAPAADVVRIYYPDWVESPIPISLPFKLAAFFAGLDVFFGNDFDLPRDGSHRYYSDRFPYGIPIGDEPGTDIDVAAPPLVPEDEVAWHGVAGPLGAVLSTIRLPESVPVSVQTVYRVSDESDEPEDVRGASPLVGRRLVGWENVPKGRHVARFYDFFPVSYHPGDERKFMRMLSDPVTTSVTPTQTELSALPAVATSAVH
jgi:hypothetical protein